MTTHTLKNQNNAKALRLKEAKRITQLLLRKNRRAKEGANTAENYFVANQEKRSLGLKTEF